VAWRNLGLSDRPLRGQGEAMGAGGRIAHAGWRRVEEGGVACVRKCPALGCRETQGVGAWVVSHGERESGRAAPRTPRPGPAPRLCHWARITSRPFCREGLRCARGAQAGEGVVGRGERVVQARRRDAQAACLCAGRGADCLSVL
jgi:hypothetical protein